ncbi:serine/threonine protein kinase [Magnetococcales bacterium HHB-1]
MIRPDLFSAEMGSGEQAQNMQPFSELKPDTIIGAVEQSGLLCNGHLLALNSYENRVYQVGVYGGEPVVVKFYRPERWSDAAILEEHRFVLDLKQAGLNVSAPLIRAEEMTLHHHEGFRFALYARYEGRSPEFGQEIDFNSLGRFLGRMHALAAKKTFQFRPQLTVEGMGRCVQRDILEKKRLPHHLEEKYKLLSEALFQQLETCFTQAGDVALIRVHGDCQMGNFLLNHNQLCLLDFDDALLAPALQDIWMLLSGSMAEMAEQLTQLLKGYQMFHPFSLGELKLFEALRTLRLMTQALWLARRWKDPAFAKTFPWYDRERYWHTHLQTLAEQHRRLGGGHGLGEFYLNL